jgi:hypothetical protein
MRPEMTRGSSWSAGDFYIPLDQPLANVIIAALEPEPQCSYASNRLLTVPRLAGANRVYLPLFRLPLRLRAAMTSWDDK